MVMHCHNFLYLYRIIILLVNFIIFLQNLVQPQVLSISHLTLIPIWSRGSNSSYHHSLAFATVLIKLINIRAVRIGNWKEFFKEKVARMAKVMIAWKYNNIVALELLYFIFCLFELKNK